MAETHLYLTIHRGPSPRNAEPVLASEDQELIRAVARTLGQRLGLPNNGKGERLKLLDSQEGGAGD